MKQESMLNLFPANPDFDILNENKKRNRLDLNHFCEQVKLFLNCSNDKIENLVMCEWTRHCAEPLRVSALEIVFEALEILKDRIE